MASRPDPADIVKRTDLTQGQKVSLLHDWDSELRELMVAEEENMLALTPPRVTMAEVARALAALGAEKDTYAAPTKHG